MAIQTLNALIPREALNKSEFKGFAFRQIAVSQFFCPGGTAEMTIVMLDWLVDGESPVTGRITPALPVTLA